MIAAAVVSVVAVVEDAECVAFPRVIEAVREKLLRPLLLKK